MPRLGELLVAAKLLTVEQVDQALRAQVVWGGRLGTNLIELGFIDLDGLSRALGRQHNLPAALARHFEKADPELQARLSPEQADKWSIVPLLRVGPEQKIAIASLGPLTTATRFAIAQALDIDARELVVSVAAEQRVKYQLERVYGIARSARFLRARGPTIPPFELPNLRPGSESDPEVSVEVEAPDPPPAPALAAVPEAAPEAVPDPVIPEISAPPPEQLAALIDEATAQAEPRPPADDEPTGRDRRAYVKTIVDLVEPKGDPGKMLGRIAIRKVATARLPTAPLVDERGVPPSLVEAARAIRRGPHRERVAELVIASLDKLAPTCAAATLMVVRGEAAIAWKAFSRCAPVPPELAVPVNQPGLVPQVIASKAVARAPADALGEVDRLFLGSLGKPEGELVVVPIAIAGRVMCVLAAAIDPGTAVAALEEIAAAAARAFARLMREASR